jgi:hypothetical protein
MSENSRIGFVSTMIDRCQRKRILPLYAPIPHAILPTDSIISIPQRRASMPCSLPNGWPTLTVRLRPADNLMLHKAIDLIRRATSLLWMRRMPDYCVCGELWRQHAGEEALRYYC